MTKIGYYYQGNKKHVEQLKDYDVTICIDDENKVNDIIEYNLPIKIMKYNNSFYDIFISETDNLNDVLASQKYAIGEFQNKKNKIRYLKELDIKKILDNVVEKEKKFSVIVPNYNNAEWIDKTIESVLNQTYQNWEMYIIDDMSTDNSVEVIKRYNDKRITLIENKIKLYNGGSRNVGILKAKESNYNGYLVFIDSDDWLSNNNVLKKLNDFIDDEDLITLDYEYYMNNRVLSGGRCHYKDKDDLFMTNGVMCAVWCKCFKVSIAPLFEFNTLMEDRNYHYRLINRINTYSNLGMVTHTWNKCNNKSVTSNKKQKYKSDL